MKQKQNKKKMAQAKKVAETVPEVSPNENEDKTEIKDEVVNENDAEIENEAENEEEMSVDNNENDNNDDELPTEEAIEKVQPTIPSQVKSGVIPEDFPADRVIHINKLPKKCKQIDLVEVFAKYGAIEVVHIQTGTPNSIANIGFKTRRAAQKALAANKTAKVKGLLIEVRLRAEAPKKPKQPKQESENFRERSVYLKFLKRGTTEEQIEEHFDHCGTIERVKIVQRNSITFGFVTFTEESSVAEAIKLHNSILNGGTIGVCENAANAMEKLNKRDATLTIMLKNKQQLESLEGDKLQTIFNKCGEITSMDVVCKKNVLAFITFTTKEAVAEAFKLNGQTINDVELEIEAYNPEKPKTSVFVTNLAKDTTEDDLRELFSKSGEINTIIVKPGFAIIHFKDSDGYCKSFLLNEAILKNQMIFLEPHSIRKQNLRKHKRFPDRKMHFKRKTTQENGSNSFVAKRVKSN